MTQKKPGKTGYSGYTGVSRKKRRQRIIFGILAMFLAFGLVGSSVFWAFDFDSPVASQGGGQVQPSLEQQIAELENQLGSQPEDPELLSALARLYWQAGRGRDAVDKYLQALDSSPEDIKIRQDLALTYYLLGDYNDAVQQIETVLEKDPQNATAYYYLGQFYAYRSDDGRDIEKGIEALEKYISLGEEGLEVENARQMLEELKSGNDG